MRILLVEDNAAIASAVRSMLEARKFAVDIASAGDTGLDYLLRETYDLAVVDVVLPVQDGFSVVRLARAQGIRIPILFLTARDAVEDRVAGLEGGGDDYLIKPFEEAEFIARINALLRRRDQPAQAIIEVGRLRIDVGARAAVFCDHELQLGSTEFRMLEFLARNAGMTFSRRQLLEKIWEYDFEGSTNIVDVYVSQLRRKMKSAAGFDVIKTVWGVGYKLA